MSAPTNILGKIGQQVGQEIKGLRTDLESQIGNINLNSINSGLTITKDPATGIGVSTDGKGVFDSLQVINEAEVGGALSVAGKITADSLEVQGDMKVINTTSVEVSDNILELNKASDDTTTATISGIEINRGITTVTTTTGGASDYEDFSYTAGINRDSQFNDLQGGFELELEGAVRTFKQAYYRDQNNAPTTDGVTNGNYAVYYASKAEDNTSDRYYICRFVESFENANNPGSTYAGWLIQRLTLPQDNSSGYIGLTNSNTDEGFFLGYIISDYGTAHEGVPTQRQKHIDIWIDSYNNGDDVEVLIDGQQMSVTPVYDTFGFGNMGAVPASFEQSFAPEADFAEGLVVYASDAVTGTAFELQSADGSSALNNGNFTFNSGNVFTGQSFDTTIRSEFDAMYDRIKQVTADVAPFAEANRDAVYDNTQNSLFQGFTASANIRFIVVDSVTFPSGGIGVLLIKLDSFTNAGGENTTLNFLLLQEDQNVAGNYVYSVFLDYKYLLNNNSDLDAFANQMPAGAGVIRQMASNGAMTMHSPNGSYASMLMNESYQAWGDGMSMVAGSGGGTTTTTTTNNDKAKILWDNATDQQKFKMMVGDSMADLSTNSLSVPDGDGITINNAPIGTFADFSNALATAKQ